MLLAGLRYKRHFSVDSYFSHPLFEAQKHPVAVRIDNKFDLLIGSTESHGLLNNRVFARCPIFLDKKSTPLQLIF